MKIKVGPFLMKKGNRLAKAAIEFDENDSFLAGFHMIGFTICEDEKKNLFVLFPSSTVTKKGDETKKGWPYFFLRPDNDTRLAKLENAILDVYENMMSSSVKR